MQDHQLAEAGLWEGIVQYPPEFIEKYIAKGYWLGQTISEFFNECAQKYAKNTAVVCAEKQLTYAELKQQIDQFSA